MAEAAAGGFYVGLGPLEMGGTVVDQGIQAGQAGTG
jgi:hypothetical protein